MKLLISILCLLVAICLTACTTRYLWSNTDPAEYVAVSQRSVSREDLESKRLKYYADDSAGIFFVEKSQLQKVRDYSIRTLGTPVTVTLDAATTILVIGVVGFAAQYYDASDAERHRQAREQKESKRIEELLEDMRENDRASPDGSIL